MAQNCPALAGAVGVLMLGALAGTGRAQPEPASGLPPAPPVEATTLALGDPAPALEVSDWIKGDPVGVLEAGTVYVIDFFATWAPGVDESCRALSRLQTSMHEGVRVVGISSSNPGRGETGERVGQFVTEMGPAVRYSIAFDAHRQSFQRYMGAIGQAGVPHCFVVDGEGRLAWHGHPADPQLAAVVDLVVKGEWDTAAYERLRQEQQKADELMGQAVEAWNENRREETVELLEEIFQLNPGRFGQHAVWKFHALHVEMGESQRAYDYARSLIEGPMSESADALADLSWVVIEAPPEREYDDIVAEWAARRALELTGDQHGHAWAAIAIIETRRENFDEATAAWEQALAYVDNEYLENVYRQKQAETAAARAEALGLPELR